MAHPPIGIARASALAAINGLLLLAPACQEPPPPGGGDTPGGGGGPDLPPVELPSCPDASLAGWSAVGRSGVDDHVWDLAAADEKSPLGPALYACGNFRKADGETVEHVARWDRSQWSALSGPSGTGLDAPCTAIEISPTDGMLYAGGSFEKAGGEWVFRWAKWDGNDWSDEPLRVEGGTLYDLHFFDLHGDPAPEQVAGGSFRNGNHLLFNGLAWSSPSAHGNLGPFPDVGLGCETNCRVMTLEDYHSDLHVAGFFNRIGNLETLNVARVADLKSFAPLGSGVGSSENNTHGIQDMAVYDGRLYVGGLFAEAGGVAASNIARWDGESWSEVDIGTNQLVEGLLPANIGDGYALYVAGFFSEVGKSMWTDTPSAGVPAQYIARYRNGTWSALGAGLGPSPGPSLDNHGMVMTTWDDGDGTCLYVGGKFQTAGEVDASNIARWCCS